jgi:hypothetical protein
MRRQGCWIGGRLGPGREQSSGWADRPGGHPHVGGLPVDGYGLPRQGEIGENKRRMGRKSDSRIYRPDR